MFRPEGTVGMQDGWCLCFQLLAEKGCIIGRTGCVCLCVACSLNVKVFALLRECSAGLSAALVWQMCL